MPSTGLRWKKRSWQLLMTQPRNMLTILVCSVDEAKTSALVGPKLSVHRLPIKAVDKEHDATPQSAA